MIAVGARKKSWLVFSWGETITETANDLAAQKLFGIITKVIFIEGIESTPQSLLDAAEEELAKNLRYLDGMTVKRSIRKTLILMSAVLQLESKRTFSLHRMV